jgi:hypothetical protein
MCLALRVCVREQVMNLSNFSTDPACQMCVVEQDAGKALIKVLHTGSTDVKKVAMQVCGQGVATSSQAHVNAHHPR